MYIYLNEVSICKLRTSSMEISTYLRLLLKLQNWEQLMLVHNLFRTGRHIHYGWAKAGRPAVFRSSTRRREGRKFNGMLAQSLGSRGVSLTRDWNVIPSTCLLGTCRSYTHTRASTHARTGTHARTHARARTEVGKRACLSEPKELLPGVAASYFTLLSCWSAALKGPVELACAFSNRTLRRTCFRWLN